jgi:UDP-N-acetylmuramate: L-alanyl-gamma-D-glutamyl-meso-diaminopimelate ligase
MNVHFIAVGGSVMHQLAIALHRKGYHVTGSDDEIFEPSRSNLTQAGISFTTGWDPSNISDSLDSVILGMHAKEDNPELLRAKELNLAIYSFPEYIYKESQNKKRVVVGGSHGKTSTTSMIMHACRVNQLVSDYLVGAKLEGFEQSVNITDAPVIVSEGDEYPASVIEKRPKFHFLNPHVAILTGIAWDHINVFPTFDIYLEQFRIFIGKIEKGGILIYDSTDQQLSKLVNETKRSDIRYQPYDVPQHQINGGATYMTIEGESTALQVFGNHNLLNMHAAYYACRELGLNTKQFVGAMGSFTGAAKRLELLAKSDATIVYRDFAHAPSKLVATVNAVKKQYPGKKLIALFELHTFSSLNKNFLTEFAGTLDAADIAAVFYSMHALEIKRLEDPGIENVRSGFNKPGMMVFNQQDALAGWLEGLAYEDSVVLLMSSGNFEGLDIVTFARKITRNSVDKVI